MFYFCKYFLSKFLSQISSLLVCRFFARLHIHNRALHLALGGFNPVHHHPASAREIGAGEEVAIAPADDEEVAHLERLAFVDVVEGLVDGWCATIEGVEVGKHLRLVSVEDLADALDCAVGALHLLSAVTAVRASCQ